MARNNISMKYFEELLAKKGIEMAPHDHPIYSGGSSITLLSDTYRPYDQKDIVPHSNDRQSSMASQQKKHK